MKKIQILLLLLVTYSIGYSQFTPSAPVGNVNTIQNDVGARQIAKGAVIGLFTDTTAANAATHIKNTPFIQITTRNGYTWLRNATATGWLLISSGNALPCAGLQAGTGIVTWASGLSFNVTLARYCINQNQYQSPSSTITLSTAHPTLPRIDVIAVDTNNAVVKITGTPATNPSVPQVNLNSQLFLTSVLVPAGASVPSGVSAITVYDENVEWTGSTVGTCTSIFDNTDSPYHLTKATIVRLINPASGQTAGVNYANGSLLSANNYTTLKFFIKLNATFSRDVQITLKASGSAITSPILLSSYGFNQSLVGTYQNISIPIQDFVFYNPLNTSFNQIEITTSQVTGDGFYLDWVTLQSGILTGTSNYIEDIYRKPATDSVFKVINGVSYFAFKDSIGGGTLWTSVGDNIYNNNYSSGNVGIGTTTPSELLDVAGTAKMLGLIYPIGAGSGKVLTSDANGEATWQTPSGGSITANAPILVSGSNISADTSKLQGRLATYNDVKLVDAQAVANAAAIQNRYDSLRRIGLQVQGRKGGVWYNAYVDSVGSGALAGDTVTAKFALISGGGTFGDNPIISTLDTIINFGASIESGGAGTGGSGINKWISYLNKDLGTTEVNRAIGGTPFCNIAGDDSAFINRLFRIPNYRKGIRYIIIGASNFINDVGLYGTGSINTYYNTVLRAIDTIAIARGYPLNKIIFLTPSTVGVTNFAVSPYNTNLSYATLKRVSDTILLAAKSKGVVTIDVFKATQNYINAGNINKFLSADSVHPTPYGHFVIANIVSTFLGTLKVNNSINVGNNITVGKSFEVQDYLMVGSNNTVNPSSSIFTANSSTKGMLPPRMTTTQRNAIVTPFNGLFIYNTTTAQYNYYDSVGSAWLNMSTGSASGWGLTGNSITAGTDFLGTMNNASLRFRTNNTENAKLDSLGVFIATNSIIGGQRLGAKGNSSTALLAAAVPVVTIGYESTSGGYGAVGAYDYGTFTPKPLSIGQNTERVLIGSNIVGNDADGISGGVLLKGDSRISGQLNVNGSGNIFLNLENNRTALWALSRNSSLGAFRLYNWVSGGSPFVVFEATDNVNMGGTTDIPSSKLTVTSTTKGSLPFPKMTETQKNAIPSPAIGLHVFQTNMIEGVYVYKSTGWQFAY